LDGAKMRKLEKNSGSEETHGELTGVRMDTSRSRWAVTTLLLRLIALLPLHPTRSITPRKRKLMKKLKNSSSD